MLCHGGEGTFYQSSTSVPLISLWIFPQRDIIYVYSHQHIWVFPRWRRRLGRLEDRAVSAASNSPRLTRNIKGERGCVSHSESSWRTVTFPRNDSRTCNQIDTLFTHGGGVVDAQKRVTRTKCRIIKTMIISIIIIILIILIIRCLKKWRRRKGATGVYNIRSWSW